MMSWRKRWARIWGEVKVCSAACRRRPRTGDITGQVIVMDGGVTTLRPLVK